VDAGRIRGVKSDPASEGRDGQLDRLKQRLLKGLNDASEDETQACA
jgi:hypothetical protein